MQSRNPYKLPSLWGLCYRFFDVEGSCKPPHSENRKCGRGTAAEGRSPDKRPRKHNKEGGGLCPHRTKNDLTALGVVVGGCHHCGRCAFRRCGCDDGSSGWQLNKAEGFAHTAQIMRSPYRGGRLCRGTHPDKVSDTYLRPNEGASQREVV